MQENQWFFPKKRMSRDCWIFYLETQQKIRRASNRDNFFSKQWQARNCCNEFAWILRLRWSHAEKLNQQIMCTGLKTLTWIQKLKQIHLQKLLQNEEFQLTLLWFCRLDDRIEPCVGSIHFLVFRVQVTLKSKNSAAKNWIFLLPYFPAPQENTSPLSDRARLV